MKTREQLLEQKIGKQDELIKALEKQLAGYASYNPDVKTLQKEIKVLNKQLDVNSWIITVRKRLEELYAKPFNGHPSREDISKNKDAIFFLADQIDILHKLRIKSK